MRHPELNHKKLEDPNPHHNDKLQEVIDTPIEPESEAIEDERRDERLPNITRKSRLPPLR